MGILNVTPDSFADGGLRFDAGARRRGRAADGRGGRGHPRHRRRVDAPGRRPLSRRRRAAARAAGDRAAGGARGVPISIDTYKAAVAREAVARGATIVNDISGLQYDPALGAVVAETGAALVLMHKRGRSRDMYKQARLRRRDGGGRCASSAKPSSGPPRPGVSRERHHRRSRGSGFAKRAPSTVRGARRALRPARRAGSPDPAAARRASRS